MSDDSQRVDAAVEAERYVLGCVLRNGYQSWHQIAVLDEADFGIKSHQKLFRYMRKLASQEVEPTFAEIYTAILQRAMEEQKAQKLETAPTASYFGFPELLDLQDGAIDSPRLGNMVKSLRRQRIDRDAWKLASQIEELAAAGISNNGPDIADLQRQLERLEGSLQINQQRVTVGTIIERCGGIDRLFQRPEGLVEWPISPLNDMMNGGLAPGTVTILAARPSDGKSALALQVAHSAVSAGHRTALFSLEMLEDELMKRLIAQNGRVSLTKIMDGHLTYEERANIMTTVSKLDELPLELFCGPHTISQITGQCLNAKDPYEFVVIDYLGLVEANGRFSNRQEKVQHVSQSVKALSMMLKKPILVLHQLGRDSEKDGNRRPYLSDLRESGSVEQDANNVVFIHQPEKKQANGPKDMFDLIIGKQRNGPRDLSARARFVKNHVKFVNPDEREEDSGQASMF